jgi:hypothetical protein
MAGRFSVSGILMVNMFGTKTKRTVIAKVRSDKLVFGDPRTAIFTKEAEFPFFFHSCLNLKSFMTKGQESSFYPKT